MDNMRPYLSTRENKHKTTNRPAIFRQFMQFTQFMAFIVTLATLVTTDIKLHAAYRRPTGSALTTHQKQQLLQQLNTLMQKPVDINPNPIDADTLTNLANTLAAAGALDQNLKTAALAHAQQLAQGNPTANREIATLRRQLGIEQATLAHQQQQAQQTIQQQQAQLQQLQQQLAQPKVPLSPIKRTPIFGGGPSQADIEALQTSVHQLRQELQRSNAEIIQLRAENATLQQRGPQPSPQIANLEAQIGSLRQEVAQQQAYVAQRDQENKILAQQLAQAPQANDAEVRQLRAELAQLHTDNTLLVQELSQTQKIQQRLTESGAQILALEEQVARLRATQGGKGAETKKIQELMTENKSIQLDVNRLEEEKARLARQIEELKRTVGQEVTQLKQRLANAEQSAQRLEEETQRSQILSQKNSTLTSAVSEKEREIQRLKETALAQNKDLTSQINQLTEQNQQQAQTISQLQAAPPVPLQPSKLEKQLEARIAQLKEELRASEARRAEGERKIEEATPQLRRITSGLEQLGKSLKEEKALTANLTAQLKSKTEEINRLSAQLAAQKVPNLQKLEEKIQAKADLIVAEKHLEVQKLKTSNATLMANNAKVGNDNITLQRRLDENREKIEALEGELARTQASRGEGIAGMQQLREEYEKLLQQLQTQRQELEQLNLLIKQQPLPTPPAPPEPRAPAHPTIIPPAAAKPTIGTPPKPSRPAAPPGARSKPMMAPPLHLRQEDTEAITQAIQENLSIFEGRKSAQNERLKKLSADQLSVEVQKAYEDLKQLDSNPQALRNLPSYSLDTYKSFLGILGPKSLETGIWVAAINFIDNAASMPESPNTLLQDITAHLREFSNWMLHYLPQTYGFNQLNKLNLNDRRRLDDFMALLNSDNESTKFDASDLSEQKAAINLFLRNIMPWYKKILENLYTSSNITMPLSEEEEKQQERESELVRSVIPEPGRKPSGKTETTLRPRLPYEGPAIPEKPEPRVEEVD